MKHLTTLVCLLLLGACAGRSPNPVQTVRAYDRSMSCAQIMAEISANNSEIVELGGEQGGKVAQNVAAGVAGLFVWPLWFAMDFQNAAGKEERALGQRNAYLSTLAHEACDDDEIATMTEALPQPAAPTEKADPEASEYRN